MSPQPKNLKPGIPLVIQVGFAGSRNLVDDEAFTEAEITSFDADLTQYLTARLKRLKSNLSAEGGPFFLCGISQLAVGADTIFTLACQASGVSQRILLPEPIEAYLGAVSPAGVSDFSPEHRVVARKLLESPHIINYQIVSTAASRGDRFEDVNLEIARISDVTVCMVRPGAKHKRGGTGDLIDRARDHGKPVLEISVALDGGRLALSETWHGLEKFKLPTLPRALRKLKMVSAVDSEVLPSPAEYFRTLKSFTSAQAKNRSRCFFVSAFVIIVSHVGATVSAAIWQQNRPQVFVSLLVVELLLLILGFATHHYMRRSEPAHTWAVSRLIAETTRSVGALVELRGHLTYLFSLPFPSDLWPLLRTLDVLHLASANRVGGRPWQALRTAYLRDRLTGTNAQLDFYERKSADSIRWLQLARGTFLLFWVGAFLAAAAELAATERLQVFHYMLGEASTLEAWCGPVAIVLPVLAVGVLSLAAAFDLEARAQTFDDMLSFLRKQQKYIENATSEREFVDLVLETESRLLAETVSWLSRRSFAEVA